MYGVYLASFRWIVAFRATENIKYADVPMNEKCLEIGEQDDENISLERTSTSTIPFNQNFPFRFAICARCSLLKQSIVASWFSVFMLSNTNALHGVRVC